MTGNLVTKDALLPLCDMKILGDEKKILELRMMMSVDVNNNPHDVYYLLSVSDIIET